MPDPSKFALVTGAGTGIGRAVSIALCSAGYTTALAGRRPELLAETATLAAQSPNAAPAIAIPADVGKPEEVRALFGEIRSRFGRLDVLFNNAGMGAPAVPMEDITYEQWSAVVAVNLTGPFLCAQEAFRLMKSQDPRGGRIINNGSISAHTPRVRSAPYTSTKHAITGLTKSISLDGRADNICCSQIDIGNAITPMTERMTQGVPQPNGSVIPEARMEVRHVADAVLYIAGLPLDTNVLFMTVMANEMPFVGRG